MAASVGETYRIRKSSMIWLAVSPWKFVSIFEGRVLEKTIWTQLPGMIIHAPMESGVLCQYWQCSYKELDAVSSKYIQKPLPAVITATTLFKQYKVWLDLSKKLPE